MQIPVGPAATPVWNAVPGAGQVLFINQDTVANITLGGVGVTPGNLLGEPLPPQTSISLPGDQAWWAAADQAYGPLLQVTARGGDLTSSPLAAAQAMIDAGVPEQIAAAITGSGISLIGNPQPVYTIGGVETTGTGLVGGTIPNQALTNPGAYDLGLTQDQADAKFVSIVGRGLAGGGQHLSVTKKFWNASDWNTGKNNLANYVTYGTKVIVCLQPVITFGLAAGSDFTTTGTAAQKAAAQADKTALAGFLTAIKGMGFTAATAQIVLHQEPGNTSKGISATDYGNMWKTYGPTVNAAALPAVINVNYGSATGPQISHATDYANAALGLRGNPATGTTFAGICMDWYTNSFMAAAYLDSTDANGDSISGIADANSLAFGLNETGCNPSKYDPAGAPYTNCTAYFTGPHGVTTFMQNRLQAGKTNLDIIYFDGLGSPTGAGDLTSPIGQDPSVSAPDFRIALYQAMFDTLTQQVAAPVTINGNSTQTMTPVNPSPAGGLAPADYLTYEIALGLTAGAASTNPWATVILTWYDFDQVAKTQVAVDRVKFLVPMGTSGDPNGPAIVYGTGRMRGGYMTIKVNNNDTVACGLVFLQVTGTSRPGRRDTWIWNINASESPAIPGYTLATAVSDGLQMGRVEGQNLTPGQSKSWLNGLFAGQVFLRCMVFGATGKNVLFQLQPQPPSIYGTTNLLNESLGVSGANDEQLFTLALPRAPMMMTIKNNEASATVTVNYQLIAIETA